MSLTWVILGVIIQVMLAYLLFMIAAFAGGSIANGSKVTRLEMKILNISIYLLPGLCIVTISFLIYYYKNDGTSLAYWWHALPVLFGIAYLIFATKKT